MNYRFCARSDAGLTRPNNEDSVTVDADQRLAVLADGMGGYNAGEVASGMATTFIRSELGRWLAQAGGRANARELRRALEICVENANRAIFNAAHANRQYEGMGTTLVLAVFQDRRLVLGHIGDSRCYRLRGGRLVQLTRDHSLLQEQLDAGLITADQAATSTQRNLVTRALGVEDTVLLELAEHRVEAGDCYLLCSDGLNDMVDDQGIAAILQMQADLEHKADRLVETANANGGRDNVSVVLACAEAGGPRRGLLSRLLGQ
ncbi:Stp1/IreP family PP2C-type Ser/Thr phosphatase [Ramlibacter rhizophilus]|uniref:Stp1/IreP family PP2C-type Ser/Thr phosphatase n=1 Tax=Ramlibacter rhizophilus TaxID=1781167 RepID=A0A4Z0BEX8_9BURK|nr:Stp1/IreP family PP2C-type Ser/Thr phosphatase [Ramlibacter rhizophilus]TFY97905.1 Stp1/IreP family PP2C-type Ser/Thr phosphatase [Ramlibacter rhizophilus]